MSKRDWLIVVPTGAQVLEAVACHSGVTVAELVGDQCAERVSQPRHLAMWLCARMLGWSSTRIGRLLGGRDHTTVLYGVRRATARLGRRTPDDVWAALITNHETRSGGALAAEMSGIER